MIKKILAVGDSFTYGEELYDVGSAYPQLLANSLGATLTNLARPGAGNKRIVRHVVESIGNGIKYDLIIIGWSSPGRQEFADADGFFDIWPGYGGNMFRKDGQTWRLPLVEYLNKHHSDHWMYRQYLIDVVMLQSFLKEHGVRYVMLNTCANEYYHSIYSSKTQELVRLVDDRYYLGWPTEGMAEWVGEAAPRGPGGHFLEEGHIKVADKLYDHIRNLGWVS